MAKSAIKLFLNFVVVASMLVAGCHGYSKGAPLRACSTMLPRHGINPQQTSAPYSISVDKVQVAPGQTVKVTLAGQGEVNFKGLLLVARDATTQEIVGKFSKVEPGLQTIECSGPDSAVTHKDKTIKTEVEVEWIAPTSVSSVTFSATVVQSVIVFWQDAVKSDVVSIQNTGLEPTATNPAPKTTTPPKQPTSQEGGTGGAESGLEITTSPSQPATSDASNNEGDTNSASHAHLSKYFVMLVFVSLLSFCIIY